MKKLLVWLLLLFTGLSCLIGCTAGDTEAPAPNAPEATEEVSEPAPVSPADSVCITHWVSMYGRPDTKMWERIEAAVNETLLQSMSLTYRLRWADYQEGSVSCSLEAFLSAGENVDLVTSRCSTDITWSGIPDLQYLAKPLALDTLLPEAAPALWKRYSPEVWAQCRVDGKIICIPGYDSSLPSGGILYRTDWAEQVGVTVIQDFASLEQYLVAVKAAGLAEYPVGYCDGIVNLFYEYIYQTTEYIPLQDFRDDHFNYYDLWGKSQEEWWQATDIWSTQEARDFLDLMVRWRKLGLWDGNAIPETCVSCVSQENNPFLQGSAAVELCGTLIYDRGYLPKIRPFNVVACGDSGPDALQKWQGTDAAGVAFMGSRLRLGSSVTGSFMAVPASALHPREALQFVDALYRDEALFHLLKYGVEGEDYTLNDKGEINYTTYDEAANSVAAAQIYEYEGETMDALPLSATGFEAFPLAYADEWDGRAAFREAIRGRAAINPYENFHPNLPEGDLTYQENSSYYIRLDSILQQLLYGAFDDPAVALQNFLTQREATNFDGRLQRVNTLLDELHASQNP